MPLQVLAAPAAAQVIHALAGENNPPGYVVLSTVTSTALPTSAHRQFALR